MAYIVSSLLRKAFEKSNHIIENHNIDELWKFLMLTPHDYGKCALFNETTRDIMQKIEFEHGGEEFDSRYPKGIPTRVVIEMKNGDSFDTGMIEFPGGHALNETVDLEMILQHKFKILGKLAMDKKELVNFVSNLESIDDMTNDQLQNIYDFNIKYADEPIDDI
jgi:2-methylcitrate dehydratase